MELSSQVLASLEAIGSSAAISEGVFKTLLSSTLKALLTPGAEQPSGGENEALCKETVFVLSTLFLELASVDADPTTVSSLLEEVKMDSNRSKAITSAFTENKTQLRSALARVRSDNTAHIVDARWRLDYYIKNNHTERVNRAEYLIELDTECYHGNESLQFACTQEQLQDLVTSLKDATKSLGRIVQ